MSVAQYVRDSAMLRLGYDAGRRGDVSPDAVLGAPAQRRGSRDETG